MSRILVADDEQSVLDAIAYALEREEFEVDTVTDGEAALAAARGSEYDLLILNVMMPRLFGTDVIRALEGERTAPIVLLSARDAREDRIDDCRVVVCHQDAGEFGQGAPCQRT